MSVLFMLSLYLLCSDVHCKARIHLYLLNNGNYAKDVEPEKRTDFHVVFTKIMCNSNFGVCLVNLRLLKLKIVKLLMFLII